MPPCRGDVPDPVQYEKEAIPKKHPLSETVRLYPQLPPVEDSTLDDSAVTGSRLSSPEAHPVPGDNHDAKPLIRRPNLAVGMFGVSDV